MVIDQGFRNCLMTENNMRFNTDCRAQVMHGSVSSGRFRGISNIQSQSSVPETNHYFVE